MDFRDSPAEAAFRAAGARLSRGAPAREDAGLLRARGRRRAGDARALAVLAADAARATAGRRSPGREAFGGRGLGPIQQIIWNQELARTGMGESSFVVGIGMAGPTIIAHGTPEQKARYLPPMLRGDEIWCQLFSEPGAGSDLAVARDPRGARRRRLGRDRAEDLVLRRPLRRLRHPARAQRSRSSRSTRASPTSSPTCARPA